MERNERLEWVLSKKVRFQRAKKKKLSWNVLHSFQNSQGFPLTFGHWFNLIVISHETPQQILTVWILITLFWYYVVLNLQYSYLMNYASRTLEFSCLSKRQRSKIAGFQAKIYWFSQCDITKRTSNKTSSKCYTLSCEFMTSYYVISKIKKKTIKH